MFKQIKNKLNEIKKILPSLGMKSIKSFIDNNFREKVVPIEGSVLYSDLLMGAEHSGIYIGNNEISNIIVRKLGEGLVRKSSPSDFTDKSLLHNKIYVSCDKKGAVGDLDVCNGAISHIGEQSFYGLVFSNCHSFSTKCVNYSRQNHMIKSLFSFNDIDETWETTIKLLKDSAKIKLGATKWKLWDWQNTNEQIEQPNTQELINQLRDMPLNAQSIELIKKELEESLEYIREVSDENIPEQARRILVSYSEDIKKIDDKYEEAKEFIEISNGGYSYNDLINLKEDFSSLVKEMKLNQSIKNIVEKLGRNHISEFKKSKSKICKRNKTEVFGIHKSNDLMRLLPSELLNLEDEDLEVLFYSKFLEESLLTYELAGKTKTEEEHKKKGPVIACLDTSGSMGGTPIIKAKSLLLSISKILEKENRSLYVILFSDVNQIKELNIQDLSESNKLLAFINQNFGGGTDFVTPLNRSIEIIQSKEEYHKADVLMITDGYCSIPDNTIKTIKEKQSQLDFSIYTIICNGVNKETCDFSDEVINI